MRGPRGYAMVMAFLQMTIMIRNCWSFDCVFCIQSKSNCRYIGSMKVKTSITLSEDILAFMDTHLEQYKTRSQFIEAAVRSFMEQIQRDEQSARCIHHQSPCSPLEPRGDGCPCVSA